MHLLAVLFEPEILWPLASCPKAPGFAIAPKDLRAGKVDGDGAQYRRYY